MGDPIFDTIIKRENFQILLLILSIIWIPGIFIFGKIYKKGQNPIHTNKQFGWLMIALGPIVFALWLIYNLIMDTFGLDSITALLINLFMFIIFGLTYGWLLKRSIS